ncbi:MAG: PIG-L family deacetylase [Victivallaceae bacterium]|nr:PIG-L family deacetylase [Victivallaceae bacterium]
MKKHDTIIIAAHDDDEALMAGGYIAKFSDSKSILVVSAVEASELQADVAKKNSIRFGYDYMPLLNPLFHTEIPDLARQLVAIIETCEPETIITHGDFDTHQDHLTVKKAVEIATRSIWRTGKHVRVPTVLFGYGVGAYENSDTYVKPNFFVELTTKHLCQKMDMMRSYSTEMFGVRTPKGAIAEAMWTGKLVGATFAEGFYLKRMVIS